jgi:MoaA/NifB/PqqE/SkfB family radical SAM enzyme
MTEEWIKLKHKLDNSKRVYIFGAGFSGWRVYEHLRFYPYSFFFCDNNSEKIGTVAYGERVVSVEDAAKDSERVILIPHGKYETEMVNQLKEYHLESDEYAICYKSLIPLKKTRIEIQVVDHCNLKCKGCNHLSPLAKEYFIDIEELKKDYIQLNNLFGERIERICLLGGEPLLHPQLKDICILTRRYFKNTNIAIITNGTLLDKQNEAFWDMCVDNRISIEITEYPVNVSYAKIEKRLQDRGVDVKVFSSISSFVHYPIDELGRQDAYESFKLCDRANTCLLLSNHRIYPCAIPPNIKYYNSRFGTNINVKEEDGVSIFDEKDAESAFSKLSSPIDFCKYCDMKNAKNEIWGISSFEKNEW